MYFPCLLLNISLFPHPIIFEFIFFSPGCVLLQRQSVCAAFKDEDTWHIHSHSEAVPIINLYLTANPVPRWEETNQCENQSATCL